MIESEVIPNLWKNALFEEKKNRNILFNVLSCLVY